MALIPAPGIRSRLTQCVRSWCLDALESARRFEFGRDDGDDSFSRKKKLNDAKLHALHRQPGG